MKTTMPKVLILGKKSDAKNESTIGFCNNVINCCNKVFGPENVYVISIPSPKKTTFLKNVVFNQPFGYDNYIREQLEEIKGIKFELIISCSSLYLGYLKKYYRKQKSIVFFQNVERIYFYEKYKSTSKLTDRVLYGYVKRTESIIRKLNSRISVLNSRDALEIKKFYKRDADFVLPISFDSLAKSDLEVFVSHKEDPYLLFVGSNFYANNYGIMHFIKNVLPYINVELRVLGSCCDYLKDKVDGARNLKLLGFVDDFKGIMVNASLVVCPIYSGSGMKTKTIEALRFGKTIAGTDEAFVGIDCDFEMVGALCNSDKEFIDFINKHAHSANRINDYSLAFFDNHFSKKVFESRLREALEQIL